MKRIFTYHIKPILFVNKIYHYSISLNLIYKHISSAYTKNMSTQISEIIHLSHNHKLDIGILNFLTLFILQLKVDLLNRYKIMDESLVEDNRSNIKISYCFRSLINKGKRLVIGLYKAERSKVGAIPSITSIYNSSNWLERENFDLFGVRYKNNNDLRRILTDYGFVGSPLKKDYPLIGYKELSYNSEKGSVTYKKISLLQEYRSNEMVNPWIK